MMPDNAVLLIGLTIMLDMQVEVNVRSPESLLAAAHLFTLLMTEHNEVKDTPVAPGKGNVLLCPFRSPALQSSPIPRKSMCSLQDALALIAWLMSYRSSAREVSLHVNPIHSHPSTGVVKARQIGQLFAQVTGRTTIFHGP